MLAGDPWRRRTGTYRLVTRLPGPDTGSQFTPLHRHTERPAPACQPLMSRDAYTSSQLSMAALNSSSMSAAQGARKGRKACDGLLAAWHQRAGCSESPLLYKSASSCALQNPPSPSCVAEAGTGSRLHTRAATASSQRHAQPRIILQGQNLPTPSAALLYQGRARCGGTDEGHMTL